MSKFLLPSISLLAAFLLYALQSSVEAAPSPQFYDGMTSGTILSNFRKKRCQIDPQCYDGRYTSGSILSNFRKKRSPQFYDGMTSGTILSNFRKKRSPDPQWASSDGSAMGTILNNFRKKRSPQFADGYTSGSILSNFRKRRSPDPQFYDGMTSGTILSNFRKKRSPQLVDGYTSGSILSNFRKKRSPDPQFYDGMTSGTILSNFRKKRSPDPQFYDGMTSGTILSNFRKKRSPQFADGYTSGSILSNFRKKRSPDPQWAFSDGSATGSILNNFRKKRSPDPQFVGGAFVDGSATGSILGNFRKRRSPESLPTAFDGLTSHPKFLRAHSFVDDPSVSSALLAVKKRSPEPQFYDGLTSGTILSNFRKKRSPDPQFYDGMTSGTILSNFRKKRSPDPQFYDGMTSGTILSNFRKKRYVDGLTSGSILSNFRKRRSPDPQFADSVYSMADYSKFVIVAENEFNTPETSTQVAIHNTLWEIYEEKSKKECKCLHRHGAFTIYSHILPPCHCFEVTNGNNIKVCCSFIMSKDANCHAEILYISNNSIRFEESKNFKVGTTTPKSINSNSVVIRILEEKKNFMEKLADQWPNDVTFVINGEKCEANRQYLANASPVFRKMLFGKFAEAEQSEIVLEGIESAQVFTDFLLSVSPFRVQPNPTNVLALLKLAHQYDVPFLMRNCEEHLKLCHRIPIAERIFLAAIYDLDDLKMYTAQTITNDQWKKMWNEHKEKLKKPEFSYLLDIIMNRLN
ncbi:BTB/POZ domain-containing protein [Ditylenchus destructor]|nr:BTB/POZ domain-containing protein [Ditylenchus destructor]